MLEETHGPRIFHIWYIFKGFPEISPLGLLILPRERREPCNRNLGLAQDTSGLVSVLGRERLSRLMAVAYKHTA